MFKTNDSAKTWTPLNSTVTLPIYDLFFLNALEGFAVGGQTSCGGTGCIVPGGFILKTIDGGQTWTKVYTPVQKIEITSIDFVNASIGFCAGDNVVMKTTDGGQTWSEMKIDNLVGKMMQVKFIDHQKGFIVCLSDKIVKTEDGGLTWQITNPQLNIGYYSISAANGSIYVSGQRRTIKSTTNGSSWIDLDRSPSDIFVVHFTSDTKGYAFGRGNYSGGDFGHYYASIYCTNDGGDTWNGSADIKESGVIRDVSFPANNIGYAISRNIIIRLTTR